MRPSRTSTAPTMGFGLACASLLRARFRARFIQRSAASCEESAIGGSIEERIDECLRVEGHKILNLLARADEADGQAEFARDGHDDAALGRAVELREHDSGDAHGGGEFARL